MGKRSDFFLFYAFFFLWKALKAETAAKDEELADLRKKLEAEELNPLKLLAVEMRKSPGDKVRISVERGSPGPGGGETDGSKTIPINFASSAGGGGGGGGKQQRRRKGGDGAEAEVEMKKEIEKLR